MKYSKQDSSNSTSKAVRQLGQIFFAEKDDLLLVLIYGIGVGIFSLVVPIAAQNLVNTVAFSSLLQPVLILSLVVLFMLGFASALRIVQTLIVEKIQQRIFVRLSLDLAYRMPRVQIQNFDSKRGSELMNRFFEIMNLQKGTALILLDGLAIILQAVIGLVLLGFYHPILLAFDALLVVFIGAVILIPAKKAMQTSLDESKAKYKVAAWLDELTNNPMLFRFGGVEKFAIQKADEMTADYVFARKNHFRTLLMQIGGTLLVQTVVSALLLGVGSFLVLKNQLTLGQLVAAEIVVTMVVSGFAKFGKYLETFYDLVASSDKISNLLDLELEDDQREIPTRSFDQINIQMENISYRYEQNSRGRLSQITSEFSTGEIIGIQGPNGSGKSTFLDLIMGLRKPTHGRILVNGINLQDLDLGFYRNQIAVVRNAEVISGTLLDNIRLGRPKVSIEDTMDALKIADLDEDLATFPESINTALSGNSGPLSAGQVQKLMIARALVGKPKILILDEAFENIDLASKVKILNSLKEISANWIMIMATHDEQELGYCDKRILLPDPSSNAEKRGDL